MASGLASMGMARQVGRLFEADAGPVAGLDDAALWGRFAAGRDEAAFAGLVARHGPMVLATARAILRDHHAAEDVFQATFVALARRGGSIRRAEGFGPWLHRVAARAAVRRRAAERRRLDRERSALPRAAEPARAEVAAAVHAELDRLPASYRRPIVLCDLEGWTRASAAGHLGCTEAAVRGRLERGRARLRDRLARRGFGPALGLAGSVATWGGEASAAPVGPTLAALAARAALAAPAASGLLATVAAFGPIRGAIALGLIGSAGLAAIRQAPAGRGPAQGRGDSPPATSAPAPARATPPPAPAGPAAPKAPDEMVRLVIQVVDPDGRAVRDAMVRPFPMVIELEPVAPAGPRLFVETSPRHEVIHEVQVGSGLIAIRAPRKVLARSGAPPRDVVVASAPGFGVGYFALGLTPPPESNQLRIQLPADDVPIEGRLVDRDGHPVAGATVRVEAVYAPAGPDLSAWAADLAAFGASHSIGRATATGLLVALGGFSNLAVRSDADGRFRVTGLGRERVAELVVTAPGFASTAFAATTQARGPIVAPDRGQGLPALTIRPARFDLTLDPGRAVEGTILDRDTGAPIPGLPVRGQMGDYANLIPLPGVAGVTDAEGHYRLEGFPRDGQFQVYVRPRPGQPYLNSHFGPLGPARVDSDRPVGADFAIRRGVVLRGRVTDRATGRPIALAEVTAHARRSNPNAARFPGAGQPPRSTRADADGRFEVAALPGPGYLAVVAGGGWKVVAGPEQFEDYDPQLKSIRTWGGHVYNIHACNALIPFDSPAGDAPPVDVVLDPASTVAGRVVDPEGEPLAGTIARGLTADWWPTLANPTAEFEARGLDPARPRRAFFFHRGRKLAGSVVLRGDEAGPVTVRLGPWGELTGRLLDGGGRPAAGASILGNAGGEWGPGRGFLPDPEVLVAADGRFRLGGTIPGLTYDGLAGGRFVGWAFRDVKVGPGEARDLGDVVVERHDPDR